MNAVIEKVAPPVALGRAPSAPPRPRTNLLLQALPDTVRRRWAEHLKSIEMPRGMELDESGSAPPHVYFPTTAIVSLQYVTASGASTEIATIGNEGMVGVAMLLGGDFTLARAVVQATGFGLRLDARMLKDEFARDPAVAQRLLRYTQALMTQVGQTAVCNRHHSIEKQLCRWLLTNLDLVRGPDLVWTHERVANMLGVRREGVTEAALKLQSEGVVRYARGHIAVLDRDRLERRACECYRTVKQEFTRLLSTQPS